MILVRFTLALVLFCALLIGSTAQRSFAAPLHAVPGYSVLIPAGGTAAIPVQAIALTPGGSISAQALSVGVQPQAADRVRTALYYGIDWGYASSATYQVALAVWWVQDNNWQAVDHETAERIGTTALATEGTVGWNPDGVNMLNLIQSGQVAVAPLRLVASASHPSVGSGTLQVTNNSVNSITVYLPYGTVFGSGSEQAIVWTSGQAVQDPQAPSAPANTPEPVAPTATQGMVGKEGGAVAAPTAITESKSNPSKGKPGKPGVVPDTPRPAETPTTLPTATDPVNADSKAGSKPQESIVESVPVEVPETAPSGEKNGGTDANASSAAVEANTAAGGSVAAVRPDGSVKGPVLPPAMTATPSSGGSVPEAISTTFVPQAIDTSQPQSVIPDAQGTFEVAVPNPQATLQADVPLPQATEQGEVPVPVVTNVATIEVKPTEAAVDVPPEVFPPIDVKPTEIIEPTPIPTPVPVPSDSGVVVDASSGAATDDPSGAGSPPAEGTGAPPAINPATGAGRSDVPTWLSLLACVMMLTGWAVKYKNRTPVPARVRASSRKGE